MSNLPVKNENGTLKFRPKARLLYLLGHELISDESIATVELVKNAYDADAREIHVDLVNVVNKAAGSIEIRDDGHGMTLDNIKTAWMEPARDNKRASDGTRPRTKRFGRLPLGEKGVGRFSTDKLGQRLEIVTRHCKFDPETREAISISPIEVVVIIEGTKFLEDAYLDEIECSWKIRKPEVFLDNDHGTLLRISELRADWNRDLVRKVRLVLSRLSSPIEKAKDFEIFFDSDDFPDLSGTISNPLLEFAPYIMDGSIDENGIMKYSITTPKETKDNLETDLRKHLERFQIPNGKNIAYRKPVCGPFKFKLYAFERDKRLAPKEMDKIQLELLNSLCGVSVYRDNFRVLPYGEQGNDWLYFDKRRIQNPGVVLGNDRVIGYVEISQSLNPQLRDKTNREGLIEEGLAFGDFRDLSIEVSDILGRERWIAIPHKKRSKAKVEEGKQDIDTGNDIVGQGSVKAAVLLEDAKKNIASGNAETAQTEINHAAEALTSSTEATKRIADGKKKLLEELAVSDEEITNLIALSGIGMTAERMTHEFSRSIRLSMEQIQTALGILNKARDHPDVVQCLTLSINQLMIVREGIQQMDPLYYSKRKYSEVLNMMDICEKMKKYYSNACQELAVTVSIESDGELDFDMNKGHLMQVFSNLFDNSLYWLQFKPSEEGRKITIKISKKNGTIVFADNGQGVDKSVENHLFEPFITMKPDGRGLGLYIVADILLNYKADIELLDDGKILEGANFKITLPR
jgi:signal transduction histidine kinase